MPSLVEGSIYFYRTRFEGDTHYGHMGAKVNHIHAQNTQVWNNTSTPIQTSAVRNAFDMVIKNSVENSFWYI